MAPPPRLLLLVSLVALLSMCTRAQSEPIKDKKLSKQMSPHGPSYMKRTPYFIRPQRTIGRFYQRCYFCRDESLRLADEASFPLP